MKRIVWSCVATAFGLLLVVPSLAATATPEKVIKDSVVSNRKKRSFYVFAPDSAKAPAPLIVLLHGSGRDGMSLIDKWKDLASKEGFIIVGPDADSGGGWSLPKDGPDFLHDVVEALKSKYPINPRRVYLFGHSAGAVFALLMSTTESQYFAATAIHAGAFRSPEEYQSLSNVSRKIPVAIWVGTRDQYFPLAAVHATRDAFQSQGIPIEVTEMPGHDHWYYDLAPGINKSAWEFLRKHELESDPVYSEFTASGDAGRANQLIKEINKLGADASKLLDQANEKDRDIQIKDIVRDRAQISKSGQEQSALLRDSATNWRSAADKAETASRLNLGAKQKEYFSLIAKYNRKCAEMLDVMRERADALVSNESIEAITAKRAEARARAEKLGAEIDEIQKVIDKTMH